MENSKNTGQDKNTYIYIYIDLLKGRKKKVRNKAQKTKN